MAEQILSTLRRINSGIAIVIGLGLVVMAGIVLLDIVMRQIGSSLGGTDEISGYAMAIVTSWGMSYALLELAHVRIDFLRTRFGQKGRTLLDVVSLLALALVVSLTAFRCWPVVSRSLENGSRANTPLETPLALVQIPWFAGWIWFAIMSWLTLLCCLRLIQQGKFDRSEAHIGAFNEVESLS